jgi:hypothetical protein
MKKIILLVALAFTTNIMAEIEKSAIRGYIGGGLNRVPLTAAISTDSGSGIGVMLNGGVMLNDNSRINAYWTTANVGEEISDGSTDSDFWTVTSLGVSYDYLFGNKKHQGFFMGGGLANTTVKYNYTFTNGININGSGSSTALLVRAGYEHLFNNGLFLLAGANYDTGKQTLTGNLLSDFETKTGLNIGVSINYAF